MPETIAANTTCCMYEYYIKGSALVRKKPTRTLPLLKDMHASSSVLHLVGRFKNWAGRGPRKEADGRILSRRCPARVHLLHIGHEVLQVFADPLEPKMSKSGLNGVSYVGFLGQGENEGIEIES